MNFHIPEILGNEKQRRRLKRGGHCLADFNVPSYYDAICGCPNLCSLQIGTSLLKLCNSFPNQTFGEENIGVCHVGDGFRAFDRPGRRTQLGLGSL